MKIAILTSDGREIRRDFTPERPDFGSAIASLLQGFERIPEAEVHVISCDQGRVTPTHRLADNITFHSLHVPQIGWLRTSYLGCIRAVRKKLKELKPDIVHGQGTERDCAISAVFSGFPNVLTVHGNMRLIAKINRPRPFSYPWLAARLETFTLPRSDGVVCITNYTRQAVASLARRTWVLPNAADISFFQTSPRQPVEGRTPLMICVGSISVRKNQNAFIRALDRLASQVKFTAEFIGEIHRDDAYGREFRQLVSERPWCRYGGFFVGSANREELKKRFAQADLLALPSLEDNCPMVVLEAMASGVPVMAAKVGGVPDLIEDNRTGVFCDPLNAESMATAVGRMLQNPGFRQAITVEAHQHALDRFHPVAIARRHVEIYREVINLRT